MQINHQIQTMITEDLTHGRQLLALLEQETVAMKTRNFDLLQQLLEQKRPLMEQLKKNAIKREKWLNAVKRSEVKATWSTLFAQLKIDELKPEWDKAKAMIERCHDINNINGKLIGRGMKCQEQLLKIIRGSSTQDDLYNAKGLKSSGAMIAAYAQA